MSLVKLKNPILKKIINVYQPKYKNGVAQGLGDYLRGCFCLYQICKMNSLEFDMDISHHPMACFFDLNNKEVYFNIKRDNISWYSDPNYIPTNSFTYKKNSFHFYNEFICHLNEIKEENYYLFCNSFPIFNYIHDLSREIILNKITPTIHLKNAIETMMNNLGLSKKKFSVVHIRCGDSYLLNDNSLKIELINKIKKILHPFLIQPKKKFLILSDNNKIKYCFKNYPSCVFCVKKITHLGENGNKEEDEIKNTLVDFFVMGNANLVISLSPYNWGSGFSQWCSVLHKIPFKQFRI